MLSGSSRCATVARRPRSVIARNTTAVSNRNLMGCTASSGMGNPSSSRARSSRHQSAIGAESNERPVSLCANSFLVFRTRSRSWCSTVPMRPSAKPRSMRAPNAASGWLRPRGFSRAFASSRRIHAGAPRALGRGTPRRAQRTPDSSRPRTRAASFRTRARPHPSWRVSMVPAHGFTITVTARRLPSYTRSA